MHQLIKMELLGNKEIVACPQCGSKNTQLINPFASIGYKVMFKCEGCKEPFNDFKCLIKVGVFGELNIQYVSYSKLINISLSNQNLYFPFHFSLKSLAIACSLWLCPGLKKVFPSISLGRKSA